ncbi:MAG: dTDP-4-dehydrorhamnose reductase [Pseudomonadota bacterium]
MKILTIGRVGQLGTELARQCPADWKMTSLDLPEIDLTDAEGAARLVTEADADIVINAAAYTAVDKAEAEEDLAYAINAAAPAAMAVAAAARGAAFLHVSTDYVYDGEGTEAYTPDRPTGPLGAYGRTKLAGDEAVAAAGGPHAVLRTSWVFSAHGGNFVKTMLRLGREREKLTIVADQIGGPTAAGDIAAALLVMARSFHAEQTGSGQTGSGQGTSEQGISGIYHFSGAPDASWADFAREIFAQAGIDGVTVEDIPTTAYPTPAARPLNSRLDCASLEDTFGITRPDWRRSLAAVLKELGEIQ